MIKKVKTILWSAFCLRILDKLQNKLIKIIIIINKCCGEIDLVISSISVLRLR
jgi:hypothetical protein